jgi:hypothetical protein
MTSEVTGELGPLREALAASWAALLEAVTGLTEREFSRPAGIAEGSVSALLAALAREERASVARARALAGLESRPQPPVLEGASKVLPPQAIHDLAGARHEAQLLLEALATSTAAVGVEVRGEIEGIVAREAEAAAAIRAARAPSD